MRRELPVELLLGPDRGHRRGGDENPLAAFHGGKPGRLHIGGLVFEGFSPGFSPGYGGHRRHRGRSGYGGRSGSRAFSRRNCRELPIFGRAVGAGRALYARIPSAAGGKAVLSRADGALTATGKRAFS
jgi:hypothetical protein